MAILSKEEAQALLKKVLELIQKQMNVKSVSAGSEGGNIRYARNAVSTAGDISHDEPWQLVQLSVKKQELQPSTNLMMHHWKK